MTEMILTKEVTYELNYNGDIGEIFHFTDDKIGLRHQSWQDNIGGQTVSTLNVKGTHQPHQLITAQLVGERVYFEDSLGQVSAELFYMLPDINCCIKVTYQKEYELGQWGILWGGLMATPVYDLNLGGNIE